MNVSPLDLRQQRFGTALRGFDKVEVTSFLMAVAEDYEQADYGDDVGEGDVAADAVERALDVPGH